MTFTKSLNGSTNVLITFCYLSKQINPMLSLVLTFQNFYFTFTKIHKVQQIKHKRDKTR